MLLPHRSVVVSQHYFLSTYQKEGQTIPEFVATLQSDLAECKFNVTCECNKVVSAANLFLRTQFIRGLKDNWIKEQLLQANITEFSEFLTKAIALEASRLETQALSKQQPSTGKDTSDIHKISSQNRSRRDQHQYQKNCTRTRPKTPNYRHRSYSRPKSKSRIDYITLDIAGLCLRCGKNNHHISECQTDRYKLKCNSCQKTGHIAKVCITTLLNEKGLKKQANANASSNNGEDTTKYIHDSNKNITLGINKIFVDSLDSKQNCAIIDLYDSSAERISTIDAQKYFTTVLLNGKPAVFEVDSGAGYTLLPENEFRKLNLNISLTPTNICFRTYTNDMFFSKGKANIEVSYKKHQSSEEIYVVPEGRPAILGRIWIRRLGIKLEDVDTDMQTGSRTSTPGSIYSINDLFTQYSNVFEQKIGCIPNHTVPLKLREKATPVYTKERNVPFALRERVEKELDNLEKAGIISKIDASDWGSPLVVIPKKDGGVRLCVDYKVGVNERLVTSKHPFRNIPDILNNLRHSKYFCKLDIYKAYLHVPVDYTSSQIQAITTHRGTYRVNRLSFGIKVAPAEFNRILEQILQDLKKTESYFDDVIVHGATQEECLQNLHACLARLQVYDLHINRGKCIFFAEKIEYLGHVVQHNQISKSPAKVQAILEMPRPKNVEEVRRFLGLLTYYARFIPDLSTKTTPLRTLLKKNYNFKWSATCEAAFTHLKN
ncbi:PREDICTED: uncharacterized protein K02A2.6-like [Vollenhovia emeryi]|uniref:uncharacterized protein K02A2.6-like n=1 Tax=Vollenhovia emeryi TaxID=411798 RepID=UPI0005F3AC99|nr:PREDICTED: uncharacterized protein K02A2.6-like [Vollenhovia emeryi]